MIPEIIDKRAKLPGQVVSVNTSSRLRLQKQIDEINITIDCLSADNWQPAAEICVNNNQDDIHVINNGYISAGDVIIKPGDNSGWWHIKSTNSAEVKIKTDGILDSSPAFSAAYISNDDYKTGVYTPNSKLAYADGVFTTPDGNVDLYLVVTSGDNDIRREILHQSSVYLNTPQHDILHNCCSSSVVIDIPLGDSFKESDEIMAQIDAICWHQSLKTGEFSPPWDKYTKYMPALFLKTFKSSGLCEYGCRALLTLSYLKNIGESAIGLTKNDSIILRSLQSLLNCENI